MVPWGQHSCSVNAYSSARRLPSGPAVPMGPDCHRFDHPTAPFTGARASRNRVSWALGQSIIPMAEPQTGTQRSDGVSHPCAAVQWLWIRIAR